MNAKLDVSKNTIIFAIIIIFAIYLFMRKTEKTAEKVLEQTGFKDSSETKEERAKQKEVVIKEVQNQIWYKKELQLPLNQRTKFKVAEARNLADSLYNELRPENSKTLTNANNIYDLMKKIPTEGSLYFVIQNYGVRNGENLILALKRQMGYSNNFSKDLDEVNDLYKTRGFKFLI